MIQIALVHPQIPPNTGNIARLCAAQKCPLHLVKPLGFSTEDRYLKRAGLDYWPYVDLHYHNSLEEFLQFFENQLSSGELYFFTTKSSRSFWEQTFSSEAILVFGSETKGLPAWILEKYGNQTLTIPMKGKVRSLNLSTAVAFALSEVLRQTDLTPL